MSVALAKVESWDDHVEAWHHHGREVEDSMWGRAAIAASVKGRWGEVTKFATEVGFHRAVVHDYANTFEAFPEVSLRDDSLTFYHHLIARRCTKNAEQARVAVEHAAREGWSANALRAYLKAPVEEEKTTTTTAAPDENCDTEEGACGPVTPRDRMLHIALLMKGFNKIRNYDPAPLAQLGTKKSLKELSVQIDGVIEWLESFKTTISGRL